MTQTTIKNFLTPANQSLQTLLAKVSQLQRWSTYILSGLPEEKSLFEHCQIARYEQGILFFVADNASWATRFRFLIPQLLSILRQYPDFQSLQSIQCKICPPKYPAQTVTRKANKLSKENARMLNKAAEGIENKNLKEAIEKVAANTKPT